jgi:succinate-semialdehyde dehydrogenase/glutarate-semialdehyde dehydrogenase
VLDGHNLERTVYAAFLGRMGNTGQCCVAAKRFIALADVYDAFLTALRDRMSEVQPGDPVDPATTLGPLSSEAAAELLMEQVRDAVDKGATVVLGGGRPDLPGAFVEPTLLTDVTPDMRAYREELFGPVATVYRVANEDEAVALANTSPYGLGGGGLRGERRKPGDAATLSGTRGSAQGVGDCSGPEGPGDNEARAAIGLPAR